MRWLARMSSPPRGFRGEIVWWTNHYIFLIFAMLALTKPGVLSFGGLSCSWEAWMLCMCVYLKRGLMWLFRTHHLAPSIKVFLGLVWQQWRGSRAAWSALLCGSLKPEDWFKLINKATWKILKASIRHAMLHACN